jgi:hypothetical protein
MRHRLAILICALLLLVLLAPAGALAQDGNPFDGQLPPPQPSQTATPEPVDSGNQDDVGRTTLWVIGGALLAFFVGIGFWISRDARANLPEDERDDPYRLREEGPHKHERQAKAKARAKGRAQRQARKAHRKGKRARR